jgi:hypothetical protein
MRISKTVIDYLLILTAFVTLFSVTGIVKAKQNTEKVLKAETIKYELPFPGILPDNFFLYKLKMGRDKLWEFLISDLERKAYFEILMADKRVAAAENLFFIKNKTDLSISTLSKGFKYLEKVPPVVSALREKNFNVNNLIDKLTGATLKHEKVIEKMLTRNNLSKSDKDRLSELLKNYTDFEEKVTGLR